VLSLHYQDPRLIVLADHTCLPSTAAHPPTWRLSEVRVVLSSRAENRRAAPWSLRLWRWRAREVRAGALRVWVGWWSWFGHWCSHHAARVSLIVSVLPQHEQLLVWDA
jgi:hypothetical protein